MAFDVSNKSIVGINTIVGGLVSLQALMLIVLSWHTSLNRTEVGHLGAVVYFWNTGNFDVFHVNPPLSRIIAGTPIALLCNPEHDWKSYSPKPENRCEWFLGRDFINKNTAENLKAYIFLARLFCVPLVLLGGYFGFCFASEAYGKFSGIIYLTIWTFSPFFLGWGATICPDMMAASFGVVAIYYFRRWFLIHTWKNIVIVGLCIGLLPLAKTTWVIAFILFPLLWILSKNRPPIWQLASILTVALSILNLGYLFDGSFRLLKEYTFMSESLCGNGTNRFAESIIGYTPIPLPSEFVQGIDTQKHDFEKEMESYLFSTYRKGGWWYYYFVILALKEPLGTLLLALTAVGLMCFRQEYRVSWNDEILVLVPFVILFSLTSSQTGISIHPRYLLPVLPFFYLFISQIGRSFDLKQRSIQAVSTICLIWMVGSSLVAYPYSMAYFNEILPVKSRPKVLLGSNIDWGQNAYFLKSWLDKHPEAMPIYVEYNCPEGIERIGIKTAGKPPSEPTPGWFAIGVNDLYGSTGTYDWLKPYEPYAIVGYSIYVYNLTQDDVDRIRLRWWKIAPYCPAPLPSPPPSLPGE